MPYSNALLTIFSATFSLSSAFLGIPLSSKVNATTAAPYFLLMVIHCLVLPLLHLQN